MKIWTASLNIFPYSFEELCTVFWDRYPNSFAGHIISEDVISREITKDTIVTRKLIVKKGSALLKRLPRWVSKMTEVEVVPTLEESVYDCNSNTLVTYTRNVSHSELFEMHERCTYRPVSPSANEKWTTAASGLLRSVHITVHTGRTRRYLYENVMLIGFQKSVSGTIKGLNEKLEEQFGARNLLEKEGTALHQFSEKGHKLKEKLKEGAKEKLLEGAHLVGDQMKC